MKEKVSNTYILGLKRGQVKLVPHQTDWHKDAAGVIKKLKEILGNSAIDIQHVGSTAILNICAKPIIDIAVGVRNVADILLQREELARHGIIYRGEDVKGQLLFVLGDFLQDTRTHHIHVVKWQGKEWNDYINFRDFLNSSKESADFYDKSKRILALRFSNDRKRYTQGKKKIIDELLLKAKGWRQSRIHAENT